MFKSKKANNKKEMKEIAKIIITEEGKVNIEGDFNKEHLITLLRKELKWQEELERLEIQKQIFKDNKNK